MKLKLTGYMAAMTLAAGLLAGCGAKETTSPSPPSPPPPPPPPPPATVNFTTFVKTLLQQPGNSTPAVVNGVNFTFPNLDNPDAFDDVLPPPGTSATGTGGG